MQGVASAWSSGDSPPRAVLGNDRLSTILHWECLIKAVE